jgi:hypothetical protein
LHGLQSRKAVSIIKEHQIMVLIFTGRDFSPGVTGASKAGVFSYTCNAEYSLRRAGDTAFRLCKPVQSWSFAFMCDAGWSLRRAGGE